MTIPVHVQPDVTKLVVGFLRAQPEVTALLPAKQIRGRVGDRPSFPVVRVTRVTDGTAVTMPPVLDVVTVQLDVWGGNNRQAERIAATCKAVIVWRLPGYGNDEGLVTKAETRGMSSLPDQSYTPPRERYVLTLDVWTRPHW